MEYEITLKNKKVPELSKELGDAFRFWLASKPTAAEPAEVDLVGDRRSPGRILPYREKSAAREIQMMKIKQFRSISFWGLGPLLEAAVLSARHSVIVTARTKLAP